MPQGNCAAIEKAPETMRLARSLHLFALIVLGSFACPATGHALEIASHRDRLFAYPALLESRDNGDFLIVDYSEARDIDRRDQVPERRAKRSYVDFSIARTSREQRLGALRYFATGNDNRPAAITIFVHGAGGDGRLGNNDFSFGGNFNRIKALMAKSGGLYLSPDAGDFGANDFNSIKELISHYRTKAPTAPIVLACGSAGGAICYAAANDRDLEAVIKGYVLMGTFPSSQFVQSAAIANGARVYIGHGSRDSVFSIESMENFYAILRQNGARVRMVRFETGTHGTPIRMTDWRTALKWIIN